MTSLKIKKDIEHIIEHSGEVWQTLTDKTILLTGGTGFFGKWLLETFLYANEQNGLNAKIIVLSRDPDKFLTQYPHLGGRGLNFIKGDIRTFKYPKDAIDYILHTATEVSTVLNAQEPVDMFDTIVEGTKHILELARIKDVKAVLHTSSGAVYGKQPHDLTHIQEDFIGGQDIYEKGAAYGEGKRVAEMFSNIYYQHYGVESKIARCFAFVGPYLPLDTHFAIGNFIRDVINDNKIIIKGDGTPFRSYLYASDLIIWLLNILIFGKPCRPYNVGSDKDITIEELATLVASFSKNHKEIEILTPKSGLPPARYVPNIERAKQELNLKVHIHLKEAIGKTIEFYKKD